LLESKTKIRNKREPKENKTYLEMFKKRSFVFPKEERK
jgi:hypothetical protein